MISPSGVADRHGAGDGKDRLADHVPQLREVGRAQHGEPRDLGEEHGVKAAVVGLAVGAHQSGPVHVLFRAEPDTGGGHRHRRPVHTEGPVPAPTIPQATR